jgi:two-component system chemotaxis response regulator CheY
VSAVLNTPILVVDDFKTTIKIVHTLLKQLGFTQMDDAASGAEALQKLRSGTFGLVISDWNMQPMTGIELVRAMRADPALNATPVIMITAEAKPENVSTARSAGADGYIVKPFNAGSLKEKLTSVLGAF